MINDKKFIDDNYITADYAIKEFADYLNANNGVARTSLQTENNPTFIHEKLKVEEVLRAMLTYAPKGRPRRYVAAAVASLRDDMEGLFDLANTWGPISSLAVWVDIQHLYSQAFTLIPLHFVLAVRADSPSLVRGDPLLSDATTPTMNDTSGLYLESASVTRLDSFATQVRYCNHSNERTNIHNLLRFGCAMDIGVKPPGYGRRTLLRMSFAMILSPFSED